MFVSGGARLKKGSNRRLPDKHWWCGIDHRCIASALLVAIQSKTTKRDNNDFVDGWRGGGENDRQPLHWAAVDCPAANDPHHHLPGWWLDDQQQPQMEEDGDFVGPGGGADKATAALPRPSAEDGATWNRTVDKANEGPKELTEERRSDVIWSVDEGNGYTQQ